MTRIYLPITLTAGKPLVLDRNYKKRLTRVMRLGIGDTLEVFAGGGRFLCRIARIFSDGIELQAEQELPSPPRPKRRLILGQAIPKGERFDWLLQKATELGVAEIYPLLAERTIVHPENVEHKLQRWNEICEHAAEQSENAFPSLVYPPESLQQFLQHTPDGLKLILAERQPQPRPLADILSGSQDYSITYIVGPEGGWTPVEMDAAKSAGFMPVHLGARILRSETAGLAMAAILQYQLGDFSD